MRVRLHVWGDYACFTRPEMKVERVSYDVITPTAARGILEAIHWKPAMRWTVERIHVLKPIRFQSVRRNEVTECISEAQVKSAIKKGDGTGLGIDVEDLANCTQRHALVLRDVSYVIEARIGMTHRADPTETVRKHHEMFTRRASRGQCFHRPCLGTREFAADFRLLEENDPVPASEIDGERDLGWMLHDIDYGRNGGSPRFYRAMMRDGVIEVPSASELLGALA